MRYAGFEALMSLQRLNRYRIACNYNIRKTLCLYRANIRMSQAFLAVLGIFEVVLRNKIDAHYKEQFSETPDWFLAAMRPGGFLTENGCQGSLNKITKAYADMGGSYSHDKLLSQLSFGFWKFMFADYFITSCITSPTLPLGAWMCNRAETVGAMSVIWMVR